MQIGRLSIIVAGILLVGAMSSKTRISQSLTRSSHSNIARERAQNCLWLEPGQTIKEGYFYAHRLDPSKKWYFAGAETIEGNLLSGINQTLCDLSGNTAEVGPSGVAQNVRSATAKDLGEIFRSLYPDGPKFTQVATESLRFRPNFQKRQQTQDNNNILDFSI